MLRIDCRPYGTNGFVGYKGVERVVLLPSVYVCVTSPSNDNLHPRFGKFPVFSNSE